MVPIIVEWNKKNKNIKPLKKEKFIILILIFIIFRN